MRTLVQFNFLRPAIFDRQSYVIVDGHLDCRIDKIYLTGPVNDELVLWRCTGLRNRFSADLCAAVGAKNAFIGDLRSAFVTVQVYHSNQMCPTWTLFSLAIIEHMFYNCNYNR